MRVDSHQDVLSKSGIGLESVFCMKVWKMRQDPCFVLSASDDNKLDGEMSRRLWCCGMRWGSLVSEITYP